MKTTQIATIATQLSPARQQAALGYLLALLRGQETALLQARDEVTPGEAAPPAAANGIGKGGGWVEVKTINGHQYAYHRWREGKTLKSEYVGKVKA